MVLQVSVRGALGESEGGEAPSAHGERYVLPFFKNGMYWGGIVYKII